MAVVHIPGMLRDLTAGETVVEVNAANIRELIAQLEQRFPGISARLLEDGGIRRNIAVAIDGEVSVLGVLEKVAETSEVHFVPAIQGGRAS